MQGDGDACKEPGPDHRCRPRVSGVRAVPGLTPGTPDVSSGGEPQDRESASMGDETQQYFQLTFVFDSGDGRAKLTLQGPKDPVLGLAPAIGVSRDAKGNYHFL